MCDVLTADKIKEFCKRMEQMRSIHPEQYLGRIIALMYHLDEDMRTKYAK